MLFCVSDSPNSSNVGGGIVMAIPGIPPYYYMVLPRFFYIDTGV